MCFYSASFSLFNLVKIDKTEVSFSKGSGQEGNIYTGQTHTKSNEECAERLASTQPELVTCSTHTEITLKEIYSSLT